VKNKQFSFYVFLILTFMALSGNTMRLFSSSEKQFYNKGKSFLKEDKYKEALIAAHLVSNV